MICWICEREMDELTCVNGDYSCSHCGGSYCRENHHYVFRDSNDNIVSKPLYTDRTLEEKQCQK